MSTSLLDRVRFFRQWMKDPRSTASVLPSSRYLARRMVEAAGPNFDQVIEIGPGTGVFTSELLKRGVRPERLMVVELSLEFASALRERFPKAQVHHADARALPELVAAAEGFAMGEVDVVVCGLGFLNMPLEVARDILKAVFAVLRPEGKLVTFTYGSKPSIQPELREELGLSFERLARELRNVPPARVYVYRRALMTA
jgi:phospholipid N-methyltransferase